MPASDGLMYASRPASTPHASDSTQFVVSVRPSIGVLQKSGGSPASGSGQSSSISGLHGGGLQLQLHAAPTASSTATLIFMMGTLTIGSRRRAAAAVDEVGRLDVNHAVRRRLDSPDREPRAG